MGFMSVTHGEIVLQLVSLRMEAKIAKQAGKSTILLQLVKERATLKEKEKQKEKQEETLVTDLPKDFTFDILMRLPLESLERSRYVCKPWYNMINSPRFIKTHLHQSEMVLIFQCSAISESRRSNPFYVEKQLVRSESLPSSIIQRPVLDRRRIMCSMHFMEMKDGKTEVRSLNTYCFGKIKATCNGLVLLENTTKLGGTIIMNPVTRELLALPVGTIFRSHRESYGLAFDSCSEEYKVVHLFRDDMNYDGCEILTIGSRSWRVIDGPSHGMFGWFGYEPVLAIGALHWVPKIDNSEYIVSMSVADEKFRQTLLPVSTSDMFDGLVELRGFLAFLKHSEYNQVDLWILKDLKGGSWIKLHSITHGIVLDMIPVGCSTNGESVVLSREEDKSLYVYDFVAQQMENIEMMGFPFMCGSYIRHVNSLASWRKPQDQLEEDI